MSYESLLHTVEEKIDNVDSWTWIEKDWEGFRWPKEDWQDAIKELIEKHVNGRTVVVQAGGLQGMYPRLLSDIFERVYTFEPDPLSFHCLVNNCQKDNIIKIQAAVGQSPGLVDVLRYCEHNVGMNSIAQGNKYPVFTIDSLGLDACDFIQLDVEGYEIAALRGAKQTIDRFKPVLCIETRTDTEQAVSYHMTDLGYYEVDKYHHDSFWLPFNNRQVDDFV